MWQFNTEAQAFMLLFLFVLKLAKFIIIIAGIFNNWNECPAYLVKETSYIFNWDPET